MSEGSAISCGSLSIAVSPALLVMASKILGSSMKLFNLEIDQEIILFAFFLNRDRQVV